MPSRNANQPHGNDRPESPRVTNDASYPFGIIGEVLMNTIGVTLATYFLYMIGTILGLSAGSGSWDFGWFGSLGVLMLLVIPYVLIAGATHVSSALCTLAVLALWYICLYSESLKQRLTLLGTIFLLAFASAWYVGTGW